MTPRITDTEVGGLPLHEGRAELLEAIMRTPVEQPDHADRVDHTTELDHHRRRRLVPLVAAAAAAVLMAAVPAWRALHDGGSTRAIGPADGGSSSYGLVPSVPGGTYVALDEPGWKISYVSGSSDFHDLRYEAGGRSLELTQYPAAEYDSYYSDRQDIGTGTPVTSLGQDATMWAYSADDHTVIRTVQDGSFLEARGEGMDEQTFLATVGRLTQTDQAGYAGIMPAGAVTPYNHDDQVARLLQGVSTPPGFTDADVTLSGFNDSYQAAAQVAGSVGCAWLDQWSDRAGDQHAVIAAFRGSRDWPLLQTIASGGDYSESFWSTAGQLRDAVAGEPDAPSVADIQQAICS